jgi:hypothetical protein
MGENRDIEQLLDKLAELLKAKDKDTLILTAKGSGEVLEFSTKDLETLRKNQIGVQKEPIKVGKQQFLAILSILHKLKKVSQIRLLR